MKGHVVGVIFDMDGTLTEPGAIDFAAMYRRCGLRRSNGDLLKQIEAYTDADEKKRAHEIIVDEEMKGCERMVLRADLEEVLSDLRRARIRTAISTRNCEQAYDIFLGRLKGIL